MPLTGKYTPVTICIHLDNRYSTSSDIFWAHTECWTKSNTLFFFFFTPDEDRKQAFWAAKRLLLMPCNGNLCDELNKEKIRTNEAQYFSFSVSAYGGDCHHCSDHPADVSGITSALDVLCQVLQRILWIVQDLETDVHDKVLKLGEGERSRGEGEKHSKHHNYKTNFASGSTSGQQQQ